LVCYSCFEARGEKRRGEERRGEERKGKAENQNRKEARTDREHRYFISAIEGWVPESTSAFVIVGDSITDGRGSDTDKNTRWPDLVFNRLQSSPRTSHISIINQAAGGNRILADGLGPNALGRIDRDVLAHSGVAYAMIFEGVNDIGTGDVSPATQKLLGNRLIQAFSQIVTRVHMAGLPVFGATITPFSAPKEYAGQPYSDAEREKTRQRVNRWIRESGKFDAVVDFDKLLRNETVPSQLADAYNGGDYLHPNHAGYQRLADHFPVGLFAEFRGGVDGFD
jgi:lysophospholipase L1-like esterase